MAGYNVTATLSVKDKNFSSQMRAAIGQLEDMDKATGNSSTSVAKMGAAFGAASKVVEACLLYTSCRCSTAAYMDSKEYEAWIGSYEQHKMPFHE